MKNKLLIFTSLLFFSFSSISQEWLPVPDKLNTQCQQSFINLVNKGEISLSSLTSTLDIDWKVYADRDNVILKNKENGGNNGKKLNYLDPLLVSKVKGKWLKVHDAESKEYLGWVEARYLILSRFSLKTEGNVSVPRKAIVLTSLDELVEGNLKAEDLLEQRYYFNNPSPQVGTEIAAAQRFKILFIIKEQDGSVLLSTTDVLSGTDIENTSKIMGWMPKANVTSWSTRACLEKSSNLSNPHRVGDNNWPGYRDLNKLKTGLKENAYTKDGRFIEFSVSKIHAYKMRYPILAHKDNTDNIKQVVSIYKDVSDENTDISVVDQMMEKLKAMQKHTNIVFAIDATLSMKPYYSEIARSLEQIIENNSELMQHQIKFGLVIYRDYADGKKAYDFEPLTTDYELIQRRLNNIVCQSRDNDKPEAQYNGLKKGLNKLNLNPNQSNVVVLIGDCGNHSPDPEGFTKNDVIDIFKKKNINLIAYQVISKSSGFSTYMKFNTDAQNYITSTAADKINGIETDLDYKWEEVKSDNTFKLKWTDTDASDCDFQNMFGRFIYADLNEEMKPSLLKRSIVNTLKEYMKSIDNNVSVINQVIRGNNGCGLSSGVISDKPPEALIVFIMNNFFNEDGSNYSREQAIAYLKQTEVTLKAFVALNYLKEGEISNDINENALRNVVFLTHRELTNLQKELNRVGEAGCEGVSAQKKCFQEQMINVVKSIVGPQTTTSSIEELTMNEIWHVVFGVDFSDKDLRSRKLSDVSSMKKVKFKKLYKQFKDKAESFKVENYVHSDQWKSRKLIIHGDLFYWVPLEDLPGTTSK